MADQPLHMIRYWIEDKGIDTTFEDYYPELAEKDPVLKLALAQKKVAEFAIHARVKEIERDAPEPRDGPCPECGQWSCNGECSGDGQMGG